MSDVSLLTGWLSWLVMALGVAGLVFLLFRRERWWWKYVVPPVVVVAAVAAWVIANPLATSLFAQALTLTDMVWTGVAIAAVGLAIGSMFGTPVWRKVVSVVAAIAVVAAAGNQVNKSYAQYPRIVDLFGVSNEGQIGRPPPVTTAPVTPISGPLAAGWTPTGSGIPADGKGKVSQIDLPGTLSGFQPRDGWVYYPPAYFADNPEPLPVLVLLSGQPGDAGDWLLGDRLQNVMDDYAAQHKGIAPVVVMPDGTGSPTSNPLCADSSLGNMDTYLSKDVPNAIRSQLLVDNNTAHWAIGGFSYGGTCSIQMATNHPDLYPTFVDAAGEAEPTLGTRQQTVDTAFDGDEAKFKAINPIDIMATKKFPNTAGWFIAGSDDLPYQLEQQKIYQAAKANGMDVTYWEVPGGTHDWITPISGLEHVMPWLGQRMNLTG